jgi:hypothetical protein
LLPNLQDRIKAFRDGFGVSRFAYLVGDPVSPLMHLVLVANYTAAEAKEALSCIVEMVG